MDVVGVLIRRVGRFGLGKIRVSRIEFVVVGNGNGVVMIGVMEVFFCKERFWWSYCFGEWNLCGYKEMVSNRVGCCICFMLSLWRSMDGIVRLEDEFYEMLEDIIFVLSLDVEEGGRWVMRVCVVRVVLVMSYDWLLVWILFFFNFKFLVWKGDFSSVNDCR